MINNKTKEAKKKTTHNCYMILSIREAKRILDFVKANTIDGGSDDISCASVPIVVDSKKSIRSRKGDWQANIKTFAGEILKG